MKYLRLFEEFDTDEMTDPFEDDGSLPENVCDCEDCDCENCEDCEDCECCC